MNISIWQTSLVAVWIIVSMAKRRLLARIVPLIVMLQKSARPSGNIIADIASKDNRDPKDDPIEFTDRQKVIIEMIFADPFLSAKAISEKMSEKMSEKEGTNERTIERNLAKLKKLGILSREGGRKEGKWVIKIEK